MLRIRPKLSALHFIALLALFALSSCVDAPYAPEDGTVATPWVIAPQLSLVGPGGTPVANEAQANALNEAFNRVDRFHLVVRRARDNELVTDTVIEVTPGQDQYDLSVAVTTAQPDEQFLVSLTALEGEVVLFSTPPIAMQAVSETASSSNSAPDPVNITLEYAGPGADAASVELDEALLVLGPEASGQLTATVLDDAGEPLDDVPVVWSVANAAVAGVDDGAVTGVADGTTTVTVTTPTGLEATASIYVVSGRLAYVEGGQVKVRAAHGGDVHLPAPTSGAGTPVWAPDGGQIYYVTGGAVFRVGSSRTLVEGAWPSVSPDGLYLAAERDGTVVFANIDGSLERSGPSGTTPVWSGAGTVIVGGGSIESVDVSGSGRTTVVSGDAELPALGPGGTVAYVSDGKLMVQGTATPLAEGVTGRPSWSQGGLWLAFPGGDGVMVVPADGSAGAVPLPGLGAATDPAWKPSSPLGAPSSPSLTGLDPDPPVPGQAVNLLGGGFDRVIPENNQVFWPTPDGPQETDVTAATGSVISTMMPRRVAAGQIRVTNRSGSAVMDFVPQFGALQFAANTPWGAPVAGVQIQVLDDQDSEAASGATDGAGSLLLDGLLPGDYTVNITPPDGFVYGGSASFGVTVTTEVQQMALVLTPLVAEVVVTPSAPEMVVGQQVALSAVAYDVNGDVIPEFDAVSWNAISGHVSVSGSGLSATLVAVAPTDADGTAEYSLTLNGQVFGLTATVTSHITGSITRTTDEGTVPERLHRVTLEEGGEFAALTETDGNGEFAFEGLPAGNYVVRPATPAEGTLTPETADVTLGVGSPKGQADFVISTGGGVGEVIVVGDMNMWGPDYFSPPVFDGNDNAQWTENLSTNGANKKTVWYGGHASLLQNTSFYGTLPEWFSPAYDHLISVGVTVEVIMNTTTGGLSIPSDAGSIWIWLPTAAFDAADVAEIQSFVAGGGRVILVGELNSSFFNAANVRVQELMTSLGSGAVYNASCLYGLATTLSSDPLMTGVNTLEPVCTSYFTPGSGDQTLAWLGETPIVIRLGTGAAAASAEKLRLDFSLASIRADQTSTTRPEDGSGRQPGLKRIRR